MQFEGFRDPAWFFILLVIPLLLKWWHGRLAPARVRFPIKVPKTVGTKFPIWFLLGLKCLGVVFLVFSLARPQKAHHFTERSVEGVDIMMVMDVSASMNIEDLAASSRLSVAKQTIRDFVKARNSDRIGFVVFSGEAVTFAPPTLDYGLLLQTIREARTGELKDGTAIGDGLALAVGRLRDSKAKSRVIVLLTDGDNNVGQVDPATAGELAAGYQIKVYTIAIGKEGRVRIPIRTRIGGRVRTTYQWQNNALNPELLKHIARITKGKFYRVTEASTLRSVFKEIDSLERSKVDAKERTRYEELFERPLTLGAILLFTERLLASGWWRILP